MRSHFLSLVRGLMLEGNGFYDLWPNLWPILLFIAVVLDVGLRIYKRTLD